MPMPLASQRSRWGRDKDKKHRIAVLGGSFDPITDGHLKCACEIVHANVADEVWIVPCGRRPDKPSLKTPYIHRLIMCAETLRGDCSALIWACSPHCRLLHSLSGVLVPTVAASAPRPVTYRTASRSLPCCVVLS
jgi:hypothetical protein